MVNSDDFSSRLQKVMDYYDLSAAAFADSIEVGRSSISHIVSGRNKPSLDFVLKVIQTYPEVELYWLLNGRGSFPAGRSIKVESGGEAHSSSPATQTQVKSEVIPQANPPAVESQTSVGKEISRIVIFYTDGSFEAFNN